MRDPINPELESQRMENARHRDIDVADLIAGLGVVAISALFVWMASDDGFGSVRRMGAGFFPVVLGALGIGLGAAIVLRSIFAPQHDAAPVRLRRLIFICAAFVVFALAIEPLGLPLTILATTVVGSLADRATRLRESLLLGIGLAAGTWLIFVVLLGLSLPVLPGQR